MVGESVEHGSVRGLAGIETAQLVHRFFRSLTHNDKLHVAEQASSV